MIAMNRSRISSFVVVILGVVDIFNVKAIIRIWRKDDQGNREAKE